MSTARFIVADVFDGLATLEDGSVDVVITSPPFLALRSYLPADHPDKSKEIGSESTPAEFIDVMLRVTAELRRVLAPHGSICIELGDTYSGSGGGGGDYLEGGMREGQQQFAGSAASMKESNAAHWRQKNAWKQDRMRSGAKDAPQDEDGGYQSDQRVRYEGYRAGIRNMNNKIQGGGVGWPLAKSRTLIPQLYEIALAYGINPLTGTPSPAGQWRIRNVVTWCLDGDTVVYARTPKGEGPVRLLHLTQNFRYGQWELWDGTRWTHVLGCSDTEADDAIEIEFRNGEIVSATRNHEWPTQRGLVSTEELRVGDVVDTVRLPEPDRIGPDLLPDTEIGWFVGTFLADGSFDSRDRIQIAGHIDETAVRLPRLRRLAEAYDGSATAHHYENTASIVVRSPVLSAVLRRYLAGDSARNKTLRAAAWRRSNQFLDALLAGYLDGDGHWDAKNQRWRLGFTDNRWLARDLRVIAARLGYRCRIKRHPRAADPRGGRFAGTARFYHRGEMRFETRRDFAPTGQVVALRASKRRRFFDVGVEGEPHLFALGSGILTHNCRPNPPVGALGDKWRPATSDLIVACTSSKRYWDDLATRRPLTEPDRVFAQGQREQLQPHRVGQTIVQNAAGAPLLDYWEIPPGGYSGKTLTVHRESCGPLDGGERTTSPDCPVHAGLPGQLPRALRGARVEIDRPRTPRTDDRPESERLLGFEPTDATPDRADSFQPPKTETSDPEYSPAAKPRSKASSKKDLDPETNPPDTPSVETIPRTGGTSASPESDEHRPGTSESSTSGADLLDIPTSQMSSRIADTQTVEASSEACSCSYSKIVKEEYTSHYAVFPPELVVPCVKAMCPPKVCRVCGEPSRRIVKQEPHNGERRALADHIRQQREAKGLTQKEVAAYFPSASGGMTGCVWNWENDANVPTAEQWSVLVDLLGLSDEFAHLIGGDRVWTEDPAEYVGGETKPRRSGDFMGSGSHTKIDGGITRIGKTLGWTDCGHDDYRPGIVLDPFAGSGTTLAVATGHGYDAIGIDLDERNADLAEQRVGGFFFEREELMR